MKNFSKIAYFAAVVVATTGCATIVSENIQKINIKVIDSKTLNPVVGVRCVVNDGFGTYSVNTNPATAIVRKGGVLNVTCHKLGYLQTNTLVGDSFNITTLVNVSYWPGFTVDSVSGAYKQYPTHYVVEMTK